MVAKIDVLYAECMRDNRIFYDDLFDSFTNRNSNEVKEIASLAIEKNIEFGKRYLELGRRDVDEQFITLIMSIEALERSFSRTDIRDIEPVDEEAIELIASNEVEPKKSVQMDDLLHRYRGRLRNLVRRHKLRAFGDERAGTTSPHNDVLRTICKYYLIFRSIREQLSSFQLTARAHQFKKKIEIHERSLKYANLAIAIDQRKIESYLVKARLHKELSYFAEEPALELWRAFITLAYSFVQIDRAVEDILTLSRSRRYLDLVPQCVNHVMFKARIVNDAARICEELSLRSGFVNIHKETTRIGLRPSIAWSQIKKPINSSQFDKRVWELFDEMTIRFSEKSSKKRLSTAVRLFEHLVKFDEDETSLLSVFSSNIQDLIRMPQRKACYKELIEQTVIPRSHVHLHNLGRCMMRKGKDTEALKYYKRSLNVDPEYTAVRESMAFLLLAKGDSPSANHHLREARRIYRQKNNPRQAALEPNLANVVLEEQEQRNLLRKYLVQERTLKEEMMDSHLTILRRWNSYTPSVPTKPKSVGGGYFLSVRDIGIVIDPGFDFLHNFSEAGYSLNDINYVFISHLHSDHINDLEQLLWLFYEQRKRTGKVSNRLYICGGRNVVKSIASRLDAFQSNRSKDAPELFNDVRLVLMPAYLKSGKYSQKMLKAGKINQVANGEKGLEDFKWPTDKFKVKTVPTFHLSKSKTPDAMSCGFIISIKDGPHAELGFTSDTSWHPSLAEHFEGCNLILAHLGELYADDIDKNGKINESPTATRKHMGLHGIYKLITALHEKKAAPSIAIISEFGEELGAFRDQIAKRLNDAFFYEQIETICLTGDLDLRIHISKAKNRGSVRPVFEVRCGICGVHRYRPFEEISEFVRPVGDDSEVVYYCYRHDESIIREKLKISPQAVVS